MIKRILLVMVGVALFTGLVAYSEGAVMVYVHEKKPEGHRIWSRCRRCWLTWA